MTHKEIVEQCVDQNGQALFFCLFNDE